MQPEVVLYSTPTDAYSATARKWFKDRGVTYTEHDVTRDPVRAAELQRLTGQNAVPVIRVGGQVLVGFDPLQLAKLIPTAGRVPASNGSDPAQRVSLGMAAQSLTAARAEELGLPAPFGVLVGTVREGGPASEAGLREGDVLVGLGSYTLQDLGQLQNVVAAKRPGDSIALRAWRSGEEFDVTVNFPAVEPTTTQAGEAD